MNLYNARDQLVTVPKVEVTSAIRSLLADKFSFRLPPNTKSTMLILIIDQALSYCKVEGKKHSAEKPIPIHK